MKSLNQEISVLKAKVRRTEEDNIKKVSVFWSTYIHEKVDLSIEFLSK
jgi:hypothetical protein